MDYKPVIKDYIFASGFYGAVVSSLIEQDRVLTTIRYYQDKLGSVHKLGTKEASALLEKLKPDYLFKSSHSDVLLHGIPLQDIEKISLPRDMIGSLCALTNPDQKQSDAIEAVKFLLSTGVDKKDIGLTGSISLGFHNENSDIDLIIYGRQNFHIVRIGIVDGLEMGEIQQLDDVLWRETYERRDCELDFKTYLYHEKRKYNKFKINNSKVDVSLVLSQDELIEESGPYKKIGSFVMKTKVVDDSQSFDLPARYYVDNEKITEIVSYTATYIGQAMQGEIIEAAGVIESDIHGNKRLVVGTSREAENEYIKVLNQT